MPATRPLLTASATVQPLPFTATMPPTYRWPNTWLLLAPLASVKLLAEEPPSRPPTKRRPSTKPRAVMPAPPLRVTRPCTVRLFTILGNLVSQRNLPAGTSRLRLKGRGMYLLKTDRGTRRVTV